MPQLLHCGHPRHGKRTHRHAADVVFVLKDFGAQACHVDVGRTLAAAAFASQTAVQHFGQFLRFQDAFVFVERLCEGLTPPPSCEDFAQHIGTGAGGLGLVATDLESGTKGAANQVRLAAVAGTIALLNAAHQGMELCLCSRGTFHLAFVEGGFPVVVGLTLA